MTEANTIEADIREYIISNILDNQDDGNLTAESPLLEWGILNSLQILSLVDFMETKYSIKIEPTDLRPQNMATISSIAALVRTRQG
ncbi:hypothetical protein PPSIR1_27273 [Plesiocystis pacifica SIR-1]|uniref:Carrier domain-containing protein n=1 Tax=Plesiocystis pacifica SIR-1 TaxID=391625 RepID=A6G4L9_9BACT|nr:acyl carrier protein [Plesiocystis pacifica]EDM79139.1 hypothetical protein PPSIR1_27273 [Plesiocystis pacifica SIR-1]